MEIMQSIHLLDFTACTVTKAEGLEDVCDIPLDLTCDAVETGNAGSRLHRPFTDHSIQRLCRNTAGNITCYSVHMRSTFKYIHLGSRSEHYFGIHFDIREVLVRVHNVTTVIKMPHFIDSNQLWNGTKNMCTLLPAMSFLRTHFIKILSTDATI